MKLNQNELQRYSRQLILPELGQAGQGRLKNARVLIVGAGGLGSPSAIYLAAAGVGTLGIIDPDKVDISNLHRQVIHSTDDIGKPKVISAQKKIDQINPEVNVITYKARLNADNALKIFQDFDLIIDGTDNFPTRYLINDACILSGKPFVYGGILRFEGQCSVFGLEDGPCYRCLFQEPPGSGEILSCTEAGVIGVLPGIIGLLQANEAIKWICGMGQLLKGRLLIFDALTTRFREIQIKKDSNCLMCGQNPQIHQLMEVQLTCPTASAQKPDQISKITVNELKTILDNGRQDIYLLDVREPMEWDIAHIEGAILKPLSTFEKNFQDIPKNKTIVVHCKVGGRSQQAIQFLKSKGFTNLVNVEGGIDAWAEEINPQMPRY